MTFPEWLCEKQVEGGRKTTWLADQFGVDSSTINRWMREDRVCSKYNYDILCAGMMRIDPKITKAEAYEIVYGVPLEEPRTLAELMRQRCFLEGIRLSVIASRSGLPKKCVEGYARGGHPCTASMILLAAELGVTVAYIEGLE